MDDQGLGYIDQQDIHMHNNQNPQNSTRTKTIIIINQINSIVFSNIFMFCSNKNNIFMYVILEGIELNA